MNKEEKQHRREIFDKLSAITFFRGSVAEYEKWKGYDCEILGASYKIPYDEKELTEDDIKMCNQGIEALVNVSNNEPEVEIGNSNLIGLPLRKK
jgi:hypothetical protein